MFTDILNKNFNMIAKQIMSSHNQLHLDTCRRMIEERIAIWGDRISENDLYNLIQVREVELIAQDYPLVEG
jgi:N-dimethylarginine dimethylaminohydrolase